MATAFLLAGIEGPNGKERLLALLWLGDEATLPSVSVWLSLSSLLTLSGLHVDRRTRFKVLRGDSCCTRGKSVGGIGCPLCCALGEVGFKDPASKRITDSG